MKREFFFIGAAMLIAVITLVMLFPFENNALRAQRAAPTPAPTATPGAPRPIVPSWPTLERPLTKQEALQKAFQYDQGNVWQEPWSLDTLVSDPARITVEWYPDQTYDGTRLDEYSYRGPVWVITIKGNVDLVEDRSNRTYKQVTYRIAQLTGDLLSMSAR